MVPLLGRSAPQMNDIFVSTEGVAKLLKGLNPSKAMGSDELHLRILKELAVELGPVFAHFIICVNSHWILMKPQRNGLWQTSVPCLRKVTAIIKQLSPCLINMYSLQVTRAHSIFKHHRSP